MTYSNMHINTTQLSTVITTKYSNSGVETTVFEYTLRHFTAKFAHMNGHWKDYICIKTFVKS